MRRMERPSSPSLSRIRSAVSTIASRGVGSRRRLAARWGGRCHGGGGSAAACVLRSSAVDEQRTSDELCLHRTMVCDRTLFDTRPRCYREVPMTTIAPAGPGRTEASGRYPHRWLAAVAMMIAVLMDMIDVTIVNVALPTIRRDLGASATQLEWMVSAYMLAFAAALITAGSLGDLMGRKRLFLAGITVFGAASLAAGLVGRPWHCSPRPSSRSFTRCSKAGAWAGRPGSGCCSPRAW